jgi:hypothetical protein
LLAAGVIRNTIYAVGGMDQSTSAVNTNTAYKPPTLLPQTITFTTRPPIPAYVGDTYYVAATGGASGNPVVFSSLTPSVCTAGPSVNNASAVDLIAVGTCTVAANQGGSATYAPAPQVTQSFTVRQETTQ